MAFTMTVSELIETDKSGLLGKHATWERVPLVQVASILNGAPFDSSSFSNNAGMPLVRIRDVLTGRTNTYYNGAYDELFLVKSGDLLVGMDGDFNSNFWGSQIALLNQRVCKITPDASFYDKKFLAYALPGYLSAINKNTSSITVKHLSSKTIGDIALPLPPRAEQTRIVTKLEELLTELDAGVTELKTAKKKLVLYRQSLLKAAVEGGLTSQWRENNPVTECGKQLLERILLERRAQWEAKQLAKFAAQGKAPTKNWQKKYPEPVQPDTTNLPMLPEGWVWASVELLGDVQLGRQRSPDKLKGISPTPYIRAANITEAGIDFDDVLEMDFSEQERKVFQLQADDVLLTEASGSPEHVGRPVIWPNIDKLYCFQNTVLRFKPRCVSSEFAFYSFLAMQKLGVFSKLSGGVGINHLSAGRFSKLPLALPSASEQAVIVNTLKSQLAAVDELDVATTLALNQFSAQRQNILRVAFAGQLVAQDPNDEPASMLLERIRAQRAIQAKQPKQLKPRKTKKKESTRVTRKLADVLIEAGDWLPAQEAFRRCGIADGAKTEEIEALYAELRELDKSKLLLVDVVMDEYRRKISDRLKWVG
ncbi:TPA: restriction endonuclease subunit S [Aeromonas hydrophila]